MATSSHRDHRLRYRDPLSILKIAEFKLGKVVGDNIMVECPFHEGDAVPSCSVHLVEGMFKCHGCSAHGRFEELIAKKTVNDTSEAACEGVRRIFKEYLEEINVRVVDPGRIETWHKALMSESQEATDAIATMSLLKGIDRDTLRRFAVGWNGERYTLPIYDQHRNVVNVRYRTLEKGATQKCRNHSGHGKPARLYPFEMLDDEACRTTHANSPMFGAASAADWIYVCEGELKALLLCSWGLRAVSGTGGANTWLPEWNVWLKGRKVAVVYDVDQAGRTQARTVARQLLGCAAEVRIIELPLDVDHHPKGDVNDWAVDAGGTKEGLETLLAATPVYSFTLDDAIPVADVNLEIVPLASLEEVNDPRNHNRHVRVDAVVAAEETDVYRVPIKWRVGCLEDQRQCKECPVHQLKQHDFVAEPWCRTDLLKLVDVPEWTAATELRKRTGIPGTCAKNDIQATEFVNVQAIELIPDLDSKGNDRDTSITAFYAMKDVGDRRELHGSLHTIKGFPCSDPKSGKLVVLAYDAQPAKESIDRFTVTPELTEQLKVFRPNAWTVESIDAKLDSLYDDMSSHVTHIYDRRDMHLVFDLAYFSALEIPFNGRVAKGWTEVAVIGDSGQGKSIAFESLRTFYGLGDLAVGASTSQAGLLGSCQESSRGKRRWVYKWGKIPLNDRRLVCIEEVGGLSYELIQALRNPRSSGRHEDTKAKLTRVSTRTRLVWIANPRNNRTLAEFPHGVAALRELMGDDADIRRLDAAYFVLRGEVDLAAIRNGHVRPKQTHTRAASVGLLMWAWSRKPDDIEFDADAVTACRRHAASMSKKYSGRIPLVLDTEHDEKLARLAVALAARTFSAHEDDATILRVRACHVDHIAATLDRLYSAPACRYDAFSAKIDEETAVADSAVVIKAFSDAVLAARSTAEFLLEVVAFTTRDLAGVAAIELPAAEKLVGMLLRERAIRPNPRTPNTYNKTMGFIELLRKIVDKKLVEDTTAEEKFKDAKF